VAAELHNNTAVVDLLISTTVAGLYGARALDFFDPFPLGVEGYVVVVVVTNVSFSQR
jgi:hypothetical protein